MMVCSTVEQIQVSYQNFTPVSVVLTFCSDWSFPFLTAAIKLFHSSLRFHLKWAPLRVNSVYFEITITVAGNCQIASLLTQIGHANASDWKVTLPWRHKLRPLRSDQPQSSARLAQERDQGIQVSEPPFRKLRSVWRFSTRHVCSNRLVSGHSKDCPSSNNSCANIFQALVELRRTLLRRWDCG